MEIDPIYYYGNRESDFNLKKQLNKKVLETKKHAKEIWGHGLHGTCKLPWTVWLGCRLPQAIEK